MPADSKKTLETIATPIPDSGLLERADWTNAEVIWEQIQEAGAECERAEDYAEASELWRGAWELGRDHLPSGDLRVATSVANRTVAERRTGDAPLEGWRIGCSMRRWPSGKQGPNGSSL